MDIGKGFNITAGDLLNEYYVYRLRYERMSRALIEIGQSIDDEHLKERLQDCWRISMGFEPRAFKAPESKL